jgi:gamma-glutamylcyclotransferase (GGCT)/AIG2-like uncharacterized protein YtfP
MTSNLFVYGTLMRGYDNPAAQLLSRDAAFWGEARCQGRLYLVTYYPALVRSDEASDIVSGELFSLHTPEAAFAILDDYEGSTLPQPRYLRQLLPVIREDGSTVEAWTYVYNRPVAQLKRIASGRFREQ